MCVCAFLCACVFLCLNKGGEECMWECACTCSCVEQKNVRIIKSLEIQLNYITTISPEREVYFNSVMAVIFSVLFKTT